MKEIAKSRALKIANILSDKKAQDILIIDIEELTVIADCFVIASGRSPLQVRALCDEIEEKLEAEGERVIRKEGYEAARWIVLDYGDILVHIFHKEEREFYNIERLWEDGTNTIKIESQL